jgi:hypothetical protein
MVIFSRPTDHDAAGARRAQEEQQYRINGLLKGAFGNPADFDTSARLTFKVDRRSTVEASSELRVEAPPTADSLPKGWRALPSGYVWLGKQESPGASLALGVGRDTAKPLLLTEYDELWLDYSSNATAFSCAPQFELELAMRSPGDPAGAEAIVVARAGSPSALKARSVFDLTKATWSKKDYSYLARREIGIATEGDWRYTQDGQTSVLQRQVNERLNDIEAIGLSMSIGVQVQQINLRVALSDRGVVGGGENIEFRDLQNAPNLIDDRPGLAIRIQEALEKRFPKEFAENARKAGTHGFVLREITIFMPGDAERLVKAMPLREVLLLSQESAVNAPSFKYTLGSRVMKVNQFTSRLVVDLRTLAEKGAARYRRGILRLVPPAGSEECSTEIHDIHAVRIQDRRSPVFAINAEAWSRRQGGPFSVLKPLPGVVEDAGIVAHLPFCMLSYPDVRRDEAAEYTLNLRGNQGLVELVTGQGLAMPYWIAGPLRKDVAPDKARLISSAGATLTAKGAMPRTSREGNLLVVEGKSSALEIAWPLQARINESTWFNLAIAEGVEQINGVTITLQMADGSSIERRIVPNYSQKLVLGEHVLRSVHVRIVPAVHPFRLKLFEATLFEPRPVTYAQAFSIGQPEPVSLRPRATQVSPESDLIEIEAGRVSGSSSEISPHAPLRFTTEMQPALNWISGIHLKYRLPKRSEVCALSLQFNWANGRTERRFCPERTEGVAFIPIANWLGSIDRVETLGALQSIDWTLRVAEGGLKASSESFQVDFTAEGWTSLSAAERLHLDPLFHLGHNTVQVDENSATNIASRPFNEQVWIDLPAGTLGRLLAVGGVRSAENALFTLDRIDVRPQKLLREQQWRELVTLPFAAPPRAFPKWLVAGALLVWPWYMWRRGRWSPSKTWALGRCAVGKMAGMGSRAARAAWSIALRKVGIADSVLGLAALGPGLWLAGRLGWTLPGLMSVAACVLVAWGSYRHWRRRKDQTRVPLHVGVALLGLAGGCAVWSLGQQGFTASAAWGLLPFAAVVYAVLPDVAPALLGDLVTFVQRRWTHFRWLFALAAWLVLSAGLYMLGVRVRPPGSVNVFFALGALAAALAIRAGLLALRPMLARLLPGTASRIYGARGGVAFTGALAALAATSLALVAKAEPVAEQLGIITYLFLLAGIASAAVGLRNDVAQSLRPPAEDPPAGLG